MEEIEEGRGWELRAMGRRLVLGASSAGAGLGWGRRFGEGGKFICFALFCFAILCIFLLTVGDSGSTFADGGCTHTEDKREKS